MMSWFLLTFLFSWAKLSMFLCIYQPFIPIFSMNYPIISFSHWTTALLLLSIYRNSLYIQDILSRMSMQMFSLFFLFVRIVKCMSYGVFVVVVVVLLLVKAFPVQDLFLILLFSSSVEFHFLCLFYVQTLDPPKIYFIVSCERAISITFSRWLPSCPYTIYGIILCVL